MPQTRLAQRPNNASRTAHVIVIGLPMIGLPRSHRSALTTALCLFFPHGCIAAPSVCPLFPFLDNSLPPCKCLTVWWAEQGDSGQECVAMDVRRGKARQQEQGRQMSIGQKSQVRGRQAHGQVSCVRFKSRLSCR